MCQILPVLGEIPTGDHNPFDVLNSKNIGSPGHRQKGSGPRAGFWTGRGTEYIVLDYSQRPKMKSSLSNPLRLEQNNGNYGTYDPKYFDFKGLRLYLCVTTHD